MAVFRRRPEDFEVEEMVLFDPEGDGPHLHLWIEKRNRTTEQVAAALATVAGCPAAEVGYAGRKDRYAVTRQWFSVPARRGRGPVVGPLDGVDGVEILEVRRHRQRLRTGQLAGNRFRIVVGEVREPTEIASRAAAIRRWGLTNRFGVQRFGRHGDNPERARAMMRGERPVRGRRAARFLLSALQSELFNRFLLHRLGATASHAGSDAASRPWLLGKILGAVLPGDLLVHHRSGMLRGVEEDPSDAQEASRELRVSPTGPIAGSRMRSATLRAGELEGRFLARHEADVRSLEMRGMHGARRALRVPVGDLEIETLAQREELEAGSTLAITCRLPPGSYATELLETLFADLGLEEARPGGERILRPGFLATERADDDD